MTTVEIRLEVVIQDNTKFSMWLAGLRLQGLIPGPPISTSDVLAEAIAASIPPTSGVEVAHTKGTLL